MQVNNEHFFDEQKANFELKTLISSIIKYLPGQKTARGASIREGASVE